MSKWNKYSVYDGDGVKVYTFRAKKIKGGKSVRQGAETASAIGFQSPEQSHACTCGPWK